LPNIHADEITSGMMRDPDFSALNLVVRSSDIARYQAVHEELVKQIFDAGLQEVWFGMGYQRVSRTAAEAERSGP
jgi:hypothetical protein